LCLEMEAFTPYGEGASSNLGSIATPVARPCSAMRCDTEKGTAIDHRDTEDTENGNVP